MGHFAGAIRAYRINKGYSVRECAEKLGVAKRTLENWESGDSVPRCANLILEALTNGNGNEMPVVVVDWYLMGAVLTLSKVVFMRIEELEDRVPLIEEALKMTKHQLSTQGLFAKREDTEWLT